MAIMFVVLIKNSQMKREVSGGAMSWRNSPFFCRQSMGRCLRTFSHCHSSMAELTGVPGRTLCEHSPWCETKVMSMLLTLLFTYLAIFGLVEFWTLRVRLVLSSPKRLSNHCQGLRHTFSEIFTKFDAVPLWDPWQNRISPGTWLQIKGRKKSARPLRCVKFCTLTPKTC
jgi:hypothetical protein